MDGAVKPGRGQVQRGNTCTDSAFRPPPVLFMAADGL
jgi:hypothetical protein